MANFTWKLILGSQKRDVRNFGSSETTNKEVFQIVTNTESQLVLSEFVKCENNIPPEKNSSAIEIDGVWYQSFGGSPLYFPSFNFLIDQYLSTYKLLSPKKDIKSALDVAELYKEINEEAKRLYSMKDFVSKHVPQAKSSTAKTVKK
jgi:hypothetical protein